MAALPGFTVEEVAARLGCDVDDCDLARLNKVIDDVSAMARHHAGLAFSSDTTGLVAGALPDGVLAVVCSVAARAFGTPPDEAGIQQEAIGAHSRTIGAVAAQGVLGWWPAEVAVLQSLNPALTTRAGTISLGSWLCRA